MKKWLLCSSILAVVITLSGCASDGGYDDGDYVGPVYPASGMYYGSHDYYDYHDHYPDYIVTPRPPEDRPDRPEHRPGLKPEHPIANPPVDRPNRPSTRPANRPSSMSHQRARTASRAAPSIPSRPRPMGGGRRGGGGRRR